MKKFSFYEISKNDILRQERATAYKHLLTLYKNWNKIKIKQELKNGIYIVSGTRL